MKIIRLLMIIVYFTVSANAQNSKPKEPDVIIYGGTSAGVTAAVQAAKMGKKVIIISPDKHLGGLSSSGLGYTDSGKKEAIGGIAREFYHGIYNYYQDSASWKWQKKSEYGDRGLGKPAVDGDKRTLWIFEPHAAENVFEDLIKQNNIKVYRDEWLDRKKGVIKKEGRIVSIKTLSGKKFKAKMFIDATYEGDLMAAAGVSYTVGREPGNKYNEQWNGVQTGIDHHDHQFRVNIDPYKIPGDKKSGLLPRISSDSPGKKLEGDKKVQAYNFRLCLTNADANRIPFSKPEGYDAAQYEVLGRLFAAGWNDAFQKFDKIPNYKTDVNNHGPFSSDNIGMNYDYPDASYKRRKEIIKEHQLYQKGLYYFMSTDMRVPEKVKSSINKWGYAKDEFADNGNWPYQMYIREARRMTGVFVMTENEILGKSSVPHSIGMGSYGMDSHNVQRYVTDEGFVQNEGDVGVNPKNPYQIDYGSIIPKKNECTNLLVPVCVSSSHIAFGSIRMEPVFMILGQSAATAAALCIDKNISVQDLDYSELKAQLIKDGQVLQQPVK